MAVSVSIVCHKTPYEQLNNALNCLLRSRSIEAIYIVDNGPDDSLKKIENKSNLIQYHHIDNKGYGNGHNMAIKEIIKNKESEGADLMDHYHLVMNADVCWEGDVIEGLIKYMNEERNVGMVMPKVYYPDGVLQYTCRMLPNVIDVFLKRFLPEKLIKKRMERYLLKEHDHNASINCPYLLGSFLFFRLGSLKDIGIFDERFFMYPEDIDITRRMHERWRTMYWPGEKIIHAHAAASRKSFRMLMIHAVNMIKYFNKWGWIIDKKRVKYNRILRENIKFLPKEKREKGRG